MKNQDAILAISTLFQNARTVLLTAAENLDGDALGCLLALQAYGESKGKRMVAVNSKPVSPLYGFLGVADRIRTEVPSDRYDLVIVCDTGDIAMLGKVYDDNRAVFDSVPVINIDHHGSCYGDVCWMDASYSAACDMVAEFIEHDGGKAAITPEIAEFLLLGILYDTGCYRNTNTAPSTFERSARLLGSGADYMKLIRNLYQATSLAYARLYGEALSGLVSVVGGRGVATFVSKEAFARHGVDANALGNEFVNDYVRSVKADFVFLAKEMPDGEVRLSFRSKNESVDVRALAGEFGGGGHVMAAGAKTRLPFPEVLDIVEKFGESLS